MSDDGRSCRQIGVNEVTTTPTTADLLEQALDRVRLKSCGRTRYEGQEPYDDELMLAEIERLRAERQAAVVMLDSYERAFGPPPDWSNT